MILRTGSQLDRLVRCPASGALPQVIDARSDAEAPFRAQGTAIHRFLQRVGDVGRDAALAELDPAWLAICAQIHLPQLGTRVTYSRELALAYDLTHDTARVLQPVEPRAYEIDPGHEIALTIDLAAVDVERRRGYIGDYKGPFAWLPPPEKSYQLTGAAIALARLHDLTSVEVEYLRVRTDGTFLIHRAELDVFGIAAAAARMQVSLAEIPVLREAHLRGTVLDVVEGPWCTYCPAHDHCPGKTGLIRQVIATPGAIDYRQPLTPDSAAVLYHQVQRAKKALHQADAALHAYAKATPIPVRTEEDGSLRYFGEIEHEGNEVLDGAIAHAVLSARFGPDAANQTVTMEVTKKAITDLVRTHVAADPDGPNLTTVVTEVIAAIRQAGGASKPRTTSTREFTIDPAGDRKPRKRKALL